ncbi:MAG: hypothetical protein JOZ69_23160, partial [Myxococcales bacterium]|nr:hypothetical protein [Myxococcales bacterium]
ADDAPPSTDEPAAAPGSVPAALWWADVLGSSASLQLWTSALPLIADPDDRAVGLLEPPPARTPRPAYQASLLFAQHFGPTLLDVVSAPPGVSAYASRNEADDTTQVILVNWNVASTGIAIEVTGLGPGREPVPSPAAGPAAASTAFLLPPLSVTALDVADQGPSAAWTYDDAQHAAGLGPRALAPATGTVTIEDASAPDTSDAAPLTPPVCPGIAPPSAPVTVLGLTNGGMPSFGDDAYGWGSYTYAGSGQTAPSIAATPDGNGIHATGRVLPTAPDADYTGFGLYYSSASCLDVSSYTGLTFDFSGDLGGCLLSVIVSGSADVSVNDDPVRGTCSPDVPTCYGPSVAITPGSGTSVRVPFTAIASGMPADRLDARTLISFGWQLAAPAMTPDGGPCSADFTVANVAFY